VIAGFGVIPGRRLRTISAMPGLVPGIHVFLLYQEGADGRDKPGHDGLNGSISFISLSVFRLDKSAP
jgi:hypothetical protein